LQRLQRVAVSWFAVTAPLLNYHAFSDLRSEMNNRFGAIERRLDVIEADFKEFFRVQSMHAAELRGSRTRRA
jgi:hypothetical protein